MFKWIKQIYKGLGDSITTGVIWGKWKQISVDTKLRTLIAKSLGIIKLAVVFWEADPSCSPCLNTCASWPKTKRNNVALICLQWRCQKQTLGSEPSPHWQESGEIRQTVTQSRGDTKEHYSPVKTNQLPTQIAIRGKPGITVTGKETSLRG